MSELPPPPPPAPSTTASATGSSATSEHAEIARRIIHDRSAVGQVAVSPEGARRGLRRRHQRRRREHHTVTRVARRCPADRRRPRRQPGLVARRAVPRLHLATRREEGRLDVAHRADHRLGRGAHRLHDARRPRRAHLVSRRPVDRLHEPHPRQAVRGEGRVVAGAAQGRALPEPPQRRGLDLRPARSTSTSWPPTARAGRAT